MHYRNGKPANNGDKIVRLNGGKIEVFGVLHSAQPGNDFCNGNIAPVQNNSEYACICDCIHVDDIAAILAEKGLDQRPNPEHPPHQVRMINELRDLNTKRDALAKFIETNPRFGDLPADEQNRMQQQFEAMTAYAAVLQSRIAALMTPAPAQA